MFKGSGLRESYNSKKEIGTKIYLRPPVITNCRIGQRSSLLKVMTRTERTESSRPRPGPLDGAWRSLVYHRPRTRKYRLIHTKSS